MARRRANRRGVAKHHRHVHPAGVPGGEGSLVQLGARQRPATVERLNERLQRLRGREFVFPAGEPA